MGKEPESWIHAAPFNWTPETPLRAEPDFTTAAPPDVAVDEPRFENPVLREPAAPRAVPQAQAAPVHAPSLLLPRLTIGLAQGVGLALLLANRDGIAAPTLFSAAVMVLLFAPLCLLAGLGRMPLRSLLLWTAFASFAVGAAGAYHRWRTLEAANVGHPGFALLALTGLFLFVGQAIALAGAHSYPAFHRSAWRLAIRIALCAALAGLCWALVGAGMGFVRDHDPALPLSLATMPLVALGLALAAHLTGERLLGALQTALVFLLAVSLPLMILPAIAAVALGAMQLWHPAAALCLALGVALILAINASYGDGTSWRPYWRRRTEFFAALLLGPLALLAGLALAARMGELGWTGQRIFAAAAILVLAGYALCYAGAALISLGGGGWMQRIEGSNLAMAFAGLALIAALASPLADPARLAVASQSLRLDSGKVPPAAFDFGWLRQQGLRFGQAALLRMAAAQDKPAIARGAYDALAVPSAAGNPTPTEIGANIHVHGGTVGLPAALLAQNWAGVPGAPPCLTGAALPCDAFFTDLDGDGRNEILLVYGSDAHWWAGILRQDGPLWRVAGSLAGPPCPGSLEALRAGHFTAIRPANGWRDLLVNGLRLSVTPSAPGPMACPG